ncbi:hypothetical protein HK099_008331 [Clydaea vesicula]|uniref:protein-tyrosine-phosphatase n=1 Tax=Clydaea vesicula TaxID=447962 RepID=A0AAD5Y2H0_9FUNG|nr:hypothetical protein HK099_008331 [Clydaea vesicula]
MFKSTYHTPYHSNSSPISSSSLKKTSNNLNSNSIHPFAAQKGMMQNSSLLTNAHLNSPITVLSRDLESNLKVNGTPQVKTPVRRLFQDLKSTSSPPVPDINITSKKKELLFWDKTPMEISPSRNTKILLSSPKKFNQLFPEDANEKAKKNCSLEKVKKEFLSGSLYGLGHWNHRKCVGETENIFLTPPVQEKYVFSQEAVPTLQLQKHPVPSGSQKPIERMQLQLKFKKKLQKSLSENDFNSQPNKLRKNKEGDFMKSDKVYFDEDFLCMGIGNDLNKLELGVGPSVHVFKKELVDEITGVPYFEGVDKFKRISSKTLNKILTGEIANIPKNKLKIIDCRFPYEYEGGHVKGALNLNNFDSLRKIFEHKKNGIDGENLGDESSIIVFHCEYSLQRAPNM